MVEFKSGLKLLVNVNELFNFVQVCQNWKPDGPLRPIFSKILRLRVNCSHMEVIFCHQFITIDILTTYPFSKYYRQKFPKCAVTEYSIVMQIFDVTHSCIIGKIELEFGSSVNYPVLLVCTGAKPTWSRKLKTQLRYYHKIFLLFKANMLHWIAKVKKDKMFFYYSMDLTTKYIFHTSYTNFYSSDYLAVFI